MMRTCSGWIRGALACVALTLSLVGCEQPCVLNTDCASDELCREGSCLKSCESYYSCSEGQACYQGACQIPPAGYCERRALLEAMSEVPVRPLCEPIVVDMGDMGDMGGLSAGAEPLDMGDMGGVMTGGVTTGGVMAGGVMTGGVMTGGVMTGGVMTGGVETGGVMTGGVMTGGSVSGGVELGGAQVGGAETGGAETGGVEMGGAETGGVEMGGVEMGGVEMGGAEGGMSYQVNTPWLFTQAGALYQSPTGGGPPARWLGRGVNIHDTRSCDACTWIAPNVNEVKRRINEAVDVWGASLLRLNLESYVTANGRLQSLNLSDDQAYLRDLEEIVRHIGTKDGVYVILAPWREPLLSDEGWPTEQSEAILRLLTRTFYHAPHVIFAVSHEPRQNLDGAQDEACWAAMNSAVSAIREEEAALGASRHIVAVQGTRDQGRELAYYIDHPITAGDGVNILYETHIFNPQSALAQLLVNPAQSLPVLIGAFGPSESPQRQMTVSDAQALIAEAERQGASWVAWSFHMRCAPSSLLVDLSEAGCGVSMPLQPSPWGQVVQDQLSANP